MESKKKWLWISAAIVATVFGWIVYQRQSVPMIEQGTMREIIHVRDYRQGYEDMADVTERIDGERLTELLETYERERGGSDMAPYSMDDVQVDICVRMEGGTCQITLGEASFVSYAKKKQYNVSDSNAFLEEMLALIDGVGNGNAG